MTRFAALIALLAVVLVPVALYAQDEGGTLVSEEEKKAAEESQQTESVYKKQYIDGKFINIVERGFFIKSGFGYSLFFGDVGSDSPGGVTFETAFGYDILDEWLQIELGAMAVSAHANLDQNADGIPDNLNAKVSGSHLTVLGLANINATYQPLLRLLVKLRIGGGVAYDDGFIDGFDPKTLAAKEVSSLGGAVGGGLAVEYYTNLRHFSVGLDMDFYYLLTPKAPLFSIMPVIKYTF